MRLKQAEDALRNEVLQAEEQRAYIEMLKDQIDQKIKNIGLSFDSEQANPAIKHKVDQSRNPRMRSNNARLSNNNSVSSALNRSAQNLQKSNSQSRQIDGLIQISHLQKACEDLKTENEILSAKLEQSGMNMTQALNEQREAFQEQIEGLQKHLQQEVEQKT